MKRWGYFAITLLVLLLAAWSFYDRSLIWLAFPLSLLLSILIRTGILPQQVLRRDLLLLILSLAVLSYAVWISWLSIIRHLAFQTQAFDLAIHENLLWNCLHGKFFFSSVMDRPYLGNHTSLIYLAILPIYLLYERPETLLVLQAVLVSTAAIPLFLLARTYGLSRACALLVSILFLCHPAISRACLYDFHELCFAPLLFFTTMLFWKRRMPLAYWCSLSTLLLVKEDLSLIVLCLGVYIFLSDDHLRGLLTITIGFAAYIFFQELIIPFFAGTRASYTFYFSSLSPGLTNPEDVFAHIVKHPAQTIFKAFEPEKLRFIFQALGPLAFAPLFSLRGFILCVYGLGIAILGSNPALHSLGFQYSFNLIPEAFVALLFLLSLNRETEDRGRFISFLSLAVVFTIVFNVKYAVFPPLPSPPFAREIKTSAFKINHELIRELKNLRSQIPVEAALTAEENLVPHLARRRVIQSCIRIDPTRVHQFEYALVTPEDTPGSCLNMLSQTGLFEVIEQTKRLVLLQRKDGLRSNTHSSTFFQTLATAQLATKIRSTPLATPKLLLKHLAEAEPPVVSDRF